MTAEYEALREDEGDEEQQQQCFHHQDQSPVLAAPKPKAARVVSLDVFRGLCVFLMMLVDYGGSVFPIIAHSPWNGVRLADFVMPYFLFIAGTALAIVYKKVEDKVDATWKAIARALKLFLLGVFLQGGYLHGVASMTYGVDINKIRWMGILQRISIAYVITALCEIWLPSERWKRSGLFRHYFWQWCLVFALSFIYIGLLNGLYVPDWEFKVSEPTSYIAVSNSSYVYKVKCDTRGDLGPACNSAGLVDRYVLGIDHLYAKPAYRNLKECNKSKDGQIPPSSPSWCHASFDPEGILGSLTATVTCIIGLHFGHILVQFQDHRERLFNWSLFSISLLIIGLFLALLGVPLNKSLYTISYSMVTSCGCGVHILHFILIGGCVWLQKHHISIGVDGSSFFGHFCSRNFKYSHNCYPRLLLGNSENNLIHLIISCFIH
ncbi:hypothetical protein Dimus_026182 [Dionaea muscipula]